MINPFAKVIAVTDTVESMVTHRPYRPSLGMAAAMEVIKDGRGTLYDPAVVDAVIDLIEVQGFEIEQIVL